MKATAKIANSSTLDHLGLVLGTQCGDSVWCFSKHAPLAPGEFLYAIPGLHEGVAVAEDRHGRSGTYLLGGVTWEAGEQLAHWLCSSGAESIGEPWSNSALELGAGVGLVSLTLGLLGVRTVLATDGDASLCEIASASAARNGVDGRVRAMRLRWGDSGDLEAALAVLGGKSASLVVAADVLYESTPAAADELEQTLRALIGRGGCRRVIFCWTVRNCTEERFLPRLADLGAVSVAWRSANPNPIPIPNANPIPKPSPNPGPGPNPKLTLTVTLTLTLTLTLTRTLTPR
jgi:predicted nicotinamide N-methyase